ncbi:melanoma-associated antigen 10-like [Orycteropus afer afer]|uniref:Melanoma-associated antigen 10-like n=1 Tax=Orycteropus afer afer TaxID=1230840 RepID=A0A8B7AQV6_ORYAF|nr:melanoma-associated antigen 10-like [Orycteropus afer afer]
MRTLNAYQDFTPTPEERVPHSTQCHRPYCQPWKLRVVLPVDPHWLSSCPQSCLLSSRKVIMFHMRKRRRYTFEQDLQAKVEAEGAQVPAPKEQEESSSSSFSDSHCSLLSSSSPSSSSPSHISYPSASSASSSPLTLSTQEEGEVPTAVTPSDPQSPPRSSSSPSLMTLDRASSSPEQEESSSTLEASADTESSFSDRLEVKVTDLVKLLLLKYQMRQPITKAEMLNFVLQNYEHKFTEIFERASKCMEMVFGIDVKEMDPTIPSYVLVNSLDLTYGEMLRNDPGMPKNGLLILMLGMILLDDNCTSEEEIWKFLNMLGLYAGREHFIYGEPRQLITKDWVQANYLEYRQVPNSDPARYEFLWGPRAHAETSKMKVLEFLARVNGSDVRFFSPWFEEALRDEEERAQARVALTGSTTDRPNAQ